MRLFLPPISIAADEGFAAEKDLFGRKATGEGLTNLITTIDEPLVIALNAQWGSGKTTFLKMWAGELRKRKIGVVHFDAFENDYIEDAFSAIAGQILTLARDLRKENDSRYKRFKDKAVAAGKILARGGLKVGIKLGTVGTLNADDFKDAAKDIGSELSSIADKHIGEMLTKQREQKAALDEFRDALADLPALLSDSSDGRDGDVASDKLVIIVDELDRCRPDFALSLLEKIKHFFSVPDVYFVLGVHLGQLENSVAALYGSGIDSKTYLQKFISLTISLADDDYISDQSQKLVYCKHLSSAHEIKGDDKEFYDWYIAKVARVNGYSSGRLKKYIAP